MSKTETISRIVLEFLGIIRWALNGIADVYRDLWREFRMHFASETRPIDGFISYAAYLETICVVCRQPRRKDFGRYCSTSCAEHDAEMQAHG